jgi:hypothetical protein
MVIGVLLGAALITPALAHYGTLGHLWKEHIRPKADARYVQQAHLKAVGKARDYDAAGGITVTAAGTHTAKVLEIAVQAPDPGYVYVSHWMSFYGGGTADSGLTWLELDEGTDCVSTGNQFPANKVPGSRTLFELGADFYDTISGSMVLPVAAGSHAITLCETATQGSMTAVDGALNAIWVPSGSSTTLTGPGTTSVAPNQRIGR